MKKFKVFWSTAFAVLFICCTQIQMNAQGLCEPVEEEVTIVTTLLSSSPCLHRFESIFSIPPGTDPNSYCYNWTLNGDVVGGNPSLDWEFPCFDDALYIVCVDLFCCETGELLGESCIDFTSDCVCCTIPSSDEVQIMATQDDCIYTFTANLSGKQLAYPYCWDWIYDGTTYPGTVSADGSLTINFAGICTEFEIGIKVYCCDDEFPAGNGSFTAVDIDCCCDPTNLEQGTLVISSENNCDFTASVVFPAGTDVSDLCFNWSIDGVPDASFTGTTIDFSFDCTQNGGHYICVNYTCCENPGEPIQLCQDFVVDCPCTLPFTFGADVNQCEACFFPIYEGPCPTDIITWNYGDGSSGTDPCHTYSTPGTYTVCMTSCCPSNVDADGNIIDPVLCETVCNTLVIEELCCTIPSEDQIEITATQDDCDYTFTPYLLGQQLDYPYCWDWIYDGTNYPGTVNADGSLTINFAGICTEFEIGIKVYCCDDEFPAGNGSFTTVDIDCCCDPTNLEQGTLVISSENNCDFTASVVFPAGTDVSDLCFNWSIDAVPDASFTGTTIDFSFDCTQNGGHYICVNYTCCENPGEPIQLCQDFVVDCPCTLPFTFGADVNQCEACFFPIYEGPCPTDIITWNYGDGSSGTDPCHTYSTPGTYTVCMTSCCPSNLDAAGNVIDSTLCETICNTVVIEGPCCELPLVLDLYISKDEDCTHYFELGAFPGSDDPNNNYCVQWKLDNGPWMSGTGLWDYIHEFSCFDDPDHIICARVFCCENPELYVEICEPFQLNCPCILPSSIFLNVVSSDDCTGLLISSGSTDDYCGDICYELTLDGILVGDENTTVLPIPGSGTYIVCLTARCCDAFSDEGVQACTTITVECDPCPPIEFEDWFDYTLVNEDDCYTYQFNNLVEALPSQGDYCYVWCIDGVVVSSTLHPVYTFPGDGTYEVCLKVFCCETFEFLGQYCETIEIDCEPCPHPCEVTAMWQSVSNGLTVTFTDFSVTGSTTSITSWYWTFGDGGTSTLQNPVHTYAFSGNYSVNLYVTAVNNEGEVCESHFCWIVQTECENVDPCEGEGLFEFKKKGCLAKFHDISTTTYPVINWTWDFGDNSTPVSGGPIIFHTFPSSGNYLVTMYLTLDLGDGQTCVIQYSVLISVVCLINNDPASGSSLFPDQELNIFPNPTNGNLTIDLRGIDDDQELTIELLNLTGQIVYSEKILYTGSQFEIELFDYDSGLYTLIVGNHEDMYITKVLKE